jgi:hypothetical protein
MPLIPLLRKPGVAVERELARFQEQARTFPPRHQQLAAIRYYLHFALWECQRHWNERHVGITNYVTFLDEIERWRFESNQKVCLVTFNYDTILEMGMAQVLGIVSDNIDSYISNENYKLIKLHGSINWGREVAGIQAPHAFTEDRLIEQAANLNISNQYTIVTSHPVRMEGGRLLFPALAIPVAKKDEFSCPESHVQALRSALPEVIKIVVIGWRATEDDFLGLLRSSLKKQPPLMIVSGDDKGANETRDNMRKFGVVDMTNAISVPSGFTGLISNLGLLERFLRS